ncbi:MAG: 16S rRNA (guanine(966)-N(2))-methyltransferase RsmD, partial [Ktedonobacterales bacterium]
AQLDAAPLTDPGGLVIVQVDPREGAEVRSVPLRTLRESDERRYGSTLLLFYEHAGDITEGERDRHTEGRSEQAEQASEEE